VQCSTVLNWGLPHCSSFSPLILRWIRGHPSVVCGNSLLIFTSPSLKRNVKCSEIVSAVRKGVSDRANESKENGPLFRPRKGLLQNRIGENMRLHSRKRLLGNR
jgi:hypothetical protein